MNASNAGTAAGAPLDQRVDINRIWLRNRKSALPGGMIPLQMQGISV
ncbi:MAG: hypothetical protein HYX37_15485 [Rhizobiales bacterium]|nr:hypothetical protein [Hyphomicrobiales bacterium]